LERLSGPALKYLGATYPAVWVGMIEAQRASEGSAVTRELATVPPDIAVVLPDRIYA
jgi:hypothetical protein